MNQFVAWFTAWAIGTSFFLGIVLIGSTLGEWRRLRAAGATKPLTIIWSALLLRLAGRTFEEVQVECVGRDVWVEWDVRWGPHGYMMAEVVDRPSSKTLTLRSSREVFFIDFYTNQFTFTMRRCTRRFVKGNGAADGFLAPQGRPSSPVANATVVMM